MIRPRNLLLCFAALVTTLANLSAQNNVADVLEAPGVNLRDPAQRQSVSAQLDALMTARHQAARTKATQLGLPLRTVFQNGRVIEIADFAGNKPLYFTTHNANAAISTGANLLQLAPYSVTGSGLTVGIWDGGAVRSTHQELTGRVTIKDAAALLDHSTHVGGTIGAFGVQSAAKGMAPSVNIDSYEWTSDKSEQTGRGASYPGEAGKIYLSNHSYGIISGWYYTGLSSPRWSWYGSGTTSTSFEPDFGKYETNARDEDSLAFSLPYYLILRSAGNERLDNPAAGEPVSLTTSTTSAVTYDPASHPAGDGIYRNGYDTIGYEATAKNVLTVGSVGDAVNGSVRSLSGAYMSSYSSWGPTDDGRIKPDVVANGESLYSSFSSGDSAYGYMSGTSMATPNATGSAALVINWWDKLFPGHVMRASTLKGLLIHTADDLGTPGPDYQFGWGLVNVKAAADLLQAYKNSPGTRRVIEDQITTTTTTRTYTLTWDGSSPIRATLCWTDPAGTATTTTDLRTARLVNNLDVKVTGPTGTVYSPWVMPFVGDWTTAKFSAAAVTGVNNTDNVERVDIASPTNTGLYTVTVSYQGTLTNSAQNFSLILSGGVATASAAAPTASVISPNSIAGGTTGAKVLTVTGTGFLLGGNVKLTKTGQSDVIASGLEIRGDSITARADVTGMATGTWNVVMTNPDGQTVTMANAFTVVGSLWNENFETGAAGWTHSAETPTYTTDTWALSTAQSHSTTHSYAASAPASKNICNLNSPVIAIPAGASNLQLTFWRYFSTTSTRDGVVLEFSVDGGAWFDVTATGSGASFASGGYNGTLSNNSNALVGRAAWTGTGTTWTQTIINLTDNAKYPGHNLQARWRMATNSSGSGTGFYLDDLNLAGATPIANQPPSIVTDAVATPAPVAGLTTQLSVLGDDDGGESALTYTWAYTGGTFERPVSFSNNGTNAAKNTTATFAIAGTYTFIVTLRDPQGLTTTSSVDVVVDQTATSVSVTPPTASVPYQGTQAFTASLLDQFGDALAAQPAFTWSVSGGGTINSSGVFAGATVGGPYTVTATNGSLSGTVSVTVTKAAATVSLSNLTQTYNASSKTATVATSPAGLTTIVTYNGSTTAPTNAGDYAVVATVSNANYAGSTSGTLTINKATASVTLSNLSQVHDGNPKPVTVSTVPAGLSTTVTYNGSATVPVDYGTFAVVATVNDANYLGSTTGTLTITGLPLDAWKTNNFTSEQVASGDADDTADPDGDGLSNLAEYALGTDPHSKSTAPAPVLDASGFNLFFTRPKGLPDVTYAAESSDDLINWHSLTIELVTDGDIQTMRVRDDLSTGNTARRFIRLKFTR